jgi:hypothetical protein
VHPNDVVMTPDWRIQMIGDVHPGDLGELQLSTTRRGDLCLSGAVQSGAYFHISQLIGDAAFNFPAQGSVRIANRSMESYPAGCSCESASSAGETPAAAPAASPAGIPQPPVAASPVPAATLPMAAPPSGCRRLRPLLHTLCLRPLRQVGRQQNSVHDGNVIGNASTRHPVLECCEESYLDLHDTERYCGRCRNHEVTNSRSANLRLFQLW